MELDLHDYDPDNPSGGVVPGWYHVIVQEADEEATPKASKIKLEVIAGADAMLGKEWFEYVGRTKEAAAVQAALLIAGGLTTIDELRQAKAEKRRPSFDFGSLKGRTFVVEVVARKDDPGRTQVKYGAYYHLDDPRVEKVQKNRKIASQAAAMASSGGDGLSGTDF